MFLGASFAGCNNMKYELYEILFSNGKRYFGISKNYKKRFQGHLKSTYIRKSKTALHNAIRKYGVDDIALSLIAVGDVYYIQNLEIAIIARFNTTDRKLGYNLALGGNISPMHNPEVAKKVSDSKKGTPLSPLVYEAYRRWFAENREVFVERLSSSQKNYWSSLTEEEYTKICANRKGRPSPNKGRKITDPIKLNNIRQGVLKRGPDWLVNNIRARQNAEFTSARSRQLKEARNNINHAKRTAIVSQVISNSKWITDGQKCRRIYFSDIVPLGWKYGKIHRKSSVIE
jgi:hypothetical protein